MHGTEGGMSDGDVVAAEVRGALAAGGAVVALESTLVAQGLPWPENLDTAKRTEEAVRRGGAVPATIAVIGGCAPSWRQRGSTTSPGAGRSRMRRCVIWAGPSRRGPTRRRPSRPRSGWRVGRGSG